MSASTIPRSSMRANDVIHEAIAALMSRPMRAALTALGTVLGVGTLVAIIGLASTAQSQVSARFDALAATTITVEDHHREAPVLTPAAEHRVREQLNGVDGVGYLWPISKAKDIRLTPAGESLDAFGVVAASPGIWAAAGAEFSQGRSFDAFHDEHAQSVAVLGSAVAQRIGLPSLEQQPAILIEGRPYTVIGVLTEAPKLPEFKAQVILPAGTALSRFGEPTSSGANAAKLLVSTKAGAAVQVAAELPWALTPQDLTQVEVIPPPDPRTLRESVDRDLSTLMVVLAGICLFIGAVGIANTTLVAVMERTGEIGLRRSLGARARHIFWQVITESTLLGTLGGLVGTTLGIVTILVVALVQGWTPVIDPRLAAAAPTIGLLVGAAAGLYPSLRASRIQPTEALRR